MGIFSRRSKYSLSRFRSIVEELLPLDVATPENEEEIADLIAQMVEQLVWADQNGQNRVLDMFLEKEIMQLMIIYLNATGGLHKLKAQLLQAVSIMLTSIHNHTSFRYFFLSRNYICDIITFFGTWQHHTDETLGYLATLAKSIAASVNETTINFFFDPDQLTLPLYTHIIPFFHHREHMVRNKVKEVSLHLYSKDYDNLQDFFILYERVRGPRAFFPSLARYLAVKLRWYFENAASFCCRFFHAGISLPSFGSLVLYDPPAAIEESRKLPEDTPVIVIPTDSKDTMPYFSSWTLFVKYRGDFIDEYYDFLDFMTDLMTSIYSQPIGHYLSSVVRSLLHSSAVSLLERAKKLCSRLAQTSEHANLTPALRELFDTSIEVDTDFVLRGNPLEHEYHYIAALQLVTDLLNSTRDATLFCNLWKSIPRFIPHVLILCAHPAISDYVRIVSLRSLLMVLHKWGAILRRICPVKPDPCPIEYDEFIAAFRSTIRDEYLEIFETMVELFTDLGFRTGNVFPQLSLMDGAVPFSMRKRMRWIFPLDLDIDVVSDCAPPPLLMDILMSFLTVDGLTPPLGILQQVLRTVASLAVSYDFRLVRSAATVIIHALMEPFSRRASVARVILETGQADDATVTDRALASAYVRSLIAASEMRPAILGSDALYGPPFDFGHLMQYGFVLDSENRITIRHHLQEVNSDSLAALLSCPDGPGVLTSRPPVTISELFLAECSVLVYLRRTRDFLCSHMLEDSATPLLRLVIPPLTRSAVIKASALSPDDTLLDDQLFDLLCTIPARWRSASSLRYQGGFEFLPIAVHVSSDGFALSILSPRSLPRFSSQLEAQTRRTLGRFKTGPRVHDDEFRVESTFSSLFLRTAIAPKNAKIVVLAPLLPVSKTGRIDGLETTLEQCSFISCEWVDSPHVDVPVEPDLLLFTDPPSAAAVLAQLRSTAKTAIDLAIRDALLFCQY